MAQTTASAQIRTGVNTVLNENKNGGASPVKRNQVNSNTSAAKTGAMANSASTLQGRQPAASSGSQRGSSAEPAVRTEEIKTETKQTPKQDSVSDVRVDELTKKIQKGEASDIEVDELKKYAEENGNKDLQELIVNAQNSANDGVTKLKGKQNKEAPSIERRDDDYDDPAVDDDKFDIQQGDFIDFLMKDVVLASAAWVGKKTSGYVGMGLYKASSWAYHGVKDHAVDPAVDGVVATCNKAFKNIKEAMRDAGKYQFKYDFEAKDETTKYGNNVISDHNASMKEVVDLIGGLNGKADLSKFERLADEVFKGNFTTDINETDKVYLSTDLATGRKEAVQSRYWHDAETQTYIPIGSNQMQNFILRTYKYKELLDKGLSENKIDKTEYNQKLQEAKEGFAETARDNLLLDAPEKAFAINMSTATLLHQRAQGKVPSEEDAALARLNAQKVFLAEYIKIQRGTSDKFKSVKGLLDYSFKAAEQSKENIDKGNYDEKGKVPENKYLNELNNLNREKVNSNNLQTMREEAYQSNQSSADLNKQFAAAEQNLQFLSAQKEENDTRRNKVQETRDRIAGKKQTGQQQTITPQQRQIRDGGR